MRAKRKFTVPDGKQEKPFFPIYLSAIWIPHMEHFIKKMEIEEFDEEKQAYIKAGRMVDIQTYIHTIEQEDGAKTRLMVVFRKYQLQKED
tara:strand:+ start:588 stop:857 length:270 start_codon:yes stop_codon:yes gene_type:complete